MDSSELSEWMAFARLEPFDDPYWRSAVIAQTVFTTWTGKEKPLQDFMPRPSKAVTDQQDDARGLALMKRIAAASKAKGRV